MRLKFYGLLKYYIKICLNCVCYDSLLDLDGKYYHKKNKLLNLIYILKTNKQCINVLFISFAMYTYGYSGICSKVK